MSVPFGPYALTLEDFTRRLHETFDGFSDPRRGKNTRYTLSDAGLSAFSVFFMQSPSGVQAHLARHALYRNRWATSLVIDHVNVAEIVAAGRGR